MIDNSAKISGLSTSLLAFLAGSAVALPVQIAVIQIVIAVVSGLFGFATSLAVAALRFWFEERKERRKREEKEQ